MRSEIKMLLTDRQCAQRRRRRRKIGRIGRAAVGLNTTANGEDQSFHIESNQECSSFVVVGFGGSDDGLDWTGLDWINKKRR